MAHTLRIFAGTWPADAARCIEKKKQFKSLKLQAMEIAVQAYGILPLLTIKKPPPNWCFLVWFSYLLDFKFN